MTDDRAFGRELESLRRELTTFARHLCRCEATAEDLASDTILRAWKARDRFEPGTNMRAWTAMILRNLFLTQMRRSKWSGGSVEDLPPGMMPSMPAPQGLAVDLSDALKALRELPSDQRLAMEIVGSGGSYEDAAIELCCSVGTVKSRVARGRDALAELLA